MWSKIGNPHLYPAARKSRFHDFRAPSIAVGNGEMMGKSRPDRLSHCVAGGHHVGFLPHAGGQLRGSKKTQRLEFGSQLACILVRSRPLPGHARVASGAFRTHANLTKFPSFTTPDPHQTPKRPASVPHAHESVQAAPRSARTNPNPAQVCPGRPRERASGTPKCPTGRQDGSRGELLAWNAGPAELQSGHSSKQVAPDL